MLARSLIWTITITITVGAAGCAHAPADGQGNGELLATATDPFALRRSLARVLLEHQAWDQAAIPLQQIIASRPGDAEAHAMLGVVYRERALLDAAEDELVLATRLDPRAAAPLSDLGVTRDLAGRHPAALDAHRRAVLLAPSVAAYRINYGWSLLVSGRAAEAKAELAAALKDDPSSRRARNDLGFALAQGGDVAGAARAFAGAGPPAAAKNNLGLVYEAAGDIARACGVFDEAVMLDGTLAPALENRTRLCASPALRLAPAAARTRRSRRAALNPEDRP